MREMNGAEMVVVNEVKEDGDFTCCNEDGEGRSVIDYAISRNHMDRFESMAVVEFGISDHRTLMVNVNMGRKEVKQQRRQRKKEEDEKAWRTNEGRKRAI
jgi:hypothetical protein